MDRFCFRKLGFLLVLCFVLSAFSCGALEGNKRSKNAYATMMYMGTPRDYEYYVAIRVLFQRLVRLKANADLVLIASKDVPARWIRTLQEEGVIVKSVDNIENPYRNQPDFDERFMLTLNKIYAWSLVEYDRVVMLDADNLFVQNTDELFFCGKFCAVFINPCIFHTGLFVLQPSNEVFKDMLRELAKGRENKDGADQGFLCSYFKDLLASPLFQLPPNGSRLDGQYRLPLGYQMDASYYYLRLRWSVPCGPNSVITFPGAPWMKPWYWWSWPILPLGLSWHQQRLQTIGYIAEVPLILAEVLFYLVTIALSIISYRCRGYPSSSSKLCAWKQEQTPTYSSIVPKILIVAGLVACYLVPFFLVPRTIHPFFGWGLYLLGSMSYGIVLINVFQLQGLPVFTPWLGILGSLVVMTFPFYSNGIVRAVAVGVYASLVSPFLFWAFSRIMPKCESQGQLNKIC